MPKSYFPPKSLKDALSIPRTIFKNGGQPMYRVTIAHELGLKADSDRFRELITASSGYGLTDGSYRAEKIELQKLGEEVARGNPDAIYQALFSVELFGKFYEHFKGGSGAVPSEKVTSTL
jgi:hypothetical protein